MPEDVAEIPAMAAGDAFLAGGTWLFSEPQPGLSRLVDLTRMGWAPLTVTPAGLEIAATCTIATLAAFEPPPDWVAGPLLADHYAAFAPPLTGQYFNYRKTTIYAGSTEIQKNIISKLILGL